MEPAPDSVVKSFVGEVIDSRIKGPHDYDWVFSLKEALATEEFEQEFNFKTYCRKSSCWEILIRFEKEIPFLKFNMFVTLRRTDLSPFIVQGILVIRFVNVQGKECPVAYRLEGRLSGKGTAYEIFAVDDHIRCLLREEDYMTFPHDVLIVRAHLIVNHCCETPNSPPIDLNAPARRPTAALIALIQECLAKNT